MHEKSWVFGAFLVVTALVACTPEERNYAGQGGAGQGGAGGAGGSGGSGGSDPAIPSACEVYSDAVCNRYAACAPAAITAAFGDDMTCRIRYSIYCNALLTAGGTAWTPDGATACAAAYGLMECNDFLALPFRSPDERTPPSCVPAGGALPDGAGCIDAGQCQNGACHRALGSLCGTCGPRMVAGASCTLASDCLGHLTCWKGYCAVAGEVGEPCDEMATPCNAPWTCFGGTCAKPTQLGETCGGNGPDCALLQGYYCETSPSYTCKLVTYGAPGESCGDFSGSLGCREAALCNNGICMAPALDGEACNPSLGVGCMAPSICTNGKCTPPDSAACP
jgi:hypothetical protein